MNLEPCPDYDKPISKKTHICVHCGSTNSYAWDITRRQFLWGSAGLALGLGLTGLHVAPLELPTAVVRMGIETEDYYKKHLLAMYDRFYASKTAEEALLALDRISLYQQMLLSDGTTPKELRLMVLPSTQKHLQWPTSPMMLRPDQLPERVQKFLKVVGVFDKVQTYAKHIFFASPVEDFLGMFNVPIIATAECVTQSVILAGSIHLFNQPALASIIAHEAWHNEHNDDYFSYNASEKNAYKYEKTILRQILYLFEGELTEREKKRINGRIKVL